MRQALFLLLFIPNFLLAQVNLNQGLVAYYPFSGNANDASGNNNNPVFNNATLAADRLGNPNSAYSFNGVDNYIRIPNSPSLNPTNQISICAWVKVAGFYQGKCHGNNIVMKGDADYLQGNYMIRFDDNIYTSMQNCATSIPDVNHENFFGINSYSASSFGGYTPFIQPGEWYSVVYTCDGTTAKLYVNCQLRTSGPASGVTFSNSYDLFLGRLNDSQYPYWFNGAMDEVRIYNRPLNIDEVKAYGNCVACSTQSDFSIQQDACNRLSVSFLSNLNTYNSIEWEFGDGNTITGVSNPSHLYNNYGNYPVKLILNHDNNCSDTILKTISVGVQNDNQLILTKDTTICFGSSKQLLTKPSLSFCWSPSSFLNDSNSANPVTSTQQDITYYYTAVASGANLIVNGDFNGGNNGFSSGYNYANPNVTEGEYFVGTSPQAWNSALSNCGDHTTGNGKMMLVNGSPVPDVKVWTETVLVTPNTNYAFSTWIQALWPPNPAQLQFSINGKDIGTLITASLPTCTLTQFYTTWNSGNNTSATISIVNKNTEIQGNDFALDDISFAPVFIKRDSVIIRVDKPMVKTNNDTSICSSGQVQLNTTGAASYAWTPTAGLTNSNIANPVSSPNSTTQYIVTGTALNGCTAKDTVNINVYPSPIITKSNDVVICSNSSAQLFASGGVSYSWSPSGSLNNPSISNPVATPMSNTTYYVTVTDANTCKKTDSIRVAIRLDPVFTISSPVNICQNNSTQLNANGGHLYLCQPASSLNNPTIASPTASPQATTTYSVRITDTVCNNTSTLFTMVTVDNPIVKTNKDTSICSVDQVQLNTTGASIYAWTPSSGLSSANIANPVASPGSTTQYVVTGTTVNGCTAKDTVNINVYPKPVIAKSSDVVICKNSSVQLFASGGVVYSWTPSTSLSNASISNPVAAPVSNTTYYVTVTDVNSCKNKDSIRVGIRPDPVFSVSNSTSVCQNNSIQLIAAGGNIYSWQPANSLNDPTVANPTSTPQATTNYSVQITDTVCNNTSTLSTTVTVMPLPLVRASKSNDLDCSADFSQLNATGATKYAWAPANTLNNSQIANPIARPITQTLYIVKGTDPNGCVNYDSVTVNITGLNKSGYFMPSAFTPNNDGKNDCYRIRYWGVIEDLDFGIYNRWGERIFHTKNPSACWDGTYKGEKQNPGVYVYLITAKTSCGKVFKKGTFALIR
ncbi:MAG: T9SS type B sorting domain-containing protein [Bacteroidetes bacterium]|nr:MAG: T9SS type B sorting domain-containing protein [Bacteroidota bacterium]